MVNSNFLVKISHTILTQSETQKKLLFNLSLITEHQAKVTERQFSTPPTTSWELQLEAIKTLAKWFVKSLVVVSSLMEKAYNLLKKQLPKHQLAITKSNPNIVTVRNGGG